MKTKKSIRILAIILFSCFLTGLVCDYFYRISPKHAIKIENFRNELNLKEKQSAKTLDILKQIIIHTSIDSLIHYPFAKNDISYYVFEKGELVFWSDNNLDISNIKLPTSTDCHYILLQNAHCVSRLVSFKSTEILALITIKNNYPYENEKLINSFASGFDMDKQVQIVNGKSTDNYAVFCDHGDYLFTLSEPQTLVFNETLAVIGFIAYSVAILIFLFLYANTPYLANKKSIGLKSFNLLALSVGVFIGLGLFFNLPTLLFWNKLFTPFQYASNPLLTSISHLTVATGFFISTIYLFYFYVDIEKTKNLKGRILLLFVTILYFVLVYYLLSGLIYHSSIQLTILKFSDFSFISLWIHFLILLWGIGLALLFFKTHNWLKTRLKLALIIDFIFFVLLFLVCFLISPPDIYRLTVSITIIWLVLYFPHILPKLRNTYSYIAIWTLVFTLFLVHNSYIINNNKKQDKFKIIAQNIFINGNTENDRMADILLEELDLQIKNDKKIESLVINSDSLMVANDYLNSTYLRGFWNKYEMRLNVAGNHTDLFNEYSKFINNIGSKLKSTNFFSVPANENNMSYIGAFLSNTSKNDSIYFFMEFYPRRNFKSYSFPNLLIVSSPDIQWQLQIDITKYEHQKLVYSSGKVEFSPNTNWIPKNKSDFFTVFKNGRMHFIYAPNKHSYIIITEQQLYDQAAYLLYFLYVFLVYFSICCLLVWGYLLSKHKRKFRLGMTSKFQFAFITLLIFSFMGIFYVSVNFIQNKYKEEQIANLENKKNYIQKALQDRYYWNQDLSSQNMQALNFDLQELSYLYHTDIHVYNNRGVLEGSSQPLIFNKGLISKLISPTPYFTSNININQYEHIGKLKYLTGYCDFYNGDYLQIGYIAIPQFFSQNEIRSEIESFLAVIIQIYLIIIVLAILLSLFIGKQLSAPLNMLENKLREMRLGQRNEKIYYKLNDEIGQLVIQYNRTIDELEKSAKLLAQSERETAWKSMARQVAHEINNPLTPMKLSIQQLRRTKDLNDNQFDDYFAKSTIMLIEQIDNLSRIAGTFSDFARMPEANFERVNVAARLFLVVQLFINNYEQVQIKFFGEAQEVFAYADSEQLVQVFNNLLKNAIQAIPENRKGIIEINLKQTDGQVIIEFSDNGTGIEDDAHEKLFNPNFTTKTTGMGLGLAIAKNIIELTGGMISFTTKVNVGSTFIVKLPQAD